MKNIKGFPGGSDGKESACNSGDLDLIPESGGPLEKGLATHCSIFASRIPWPKEPGGLYTAHEITKNQTRLSN